MDGLKRIQTVEVEAESDNGTQASGESTKSVSLDKTTLHQFTIHKLRILTEEVGKIVAETGKRGVVAVAVWIERMVHSHNVPREGAASRMQFHEVLFPDSSWWRASSHKEFHLKVYYSVVPGSDKIGSVLRSVGGEGDFQGRSTHFLFFFYRELVKTTEVAEKQLVEESCYEVFALTSGQAWQVLRKRNFQFPIEVMKRLGSSKDVKMLSARNLVGPALVSTFLFFSKELFATAPEHLYQVVTHVRSMMRNTAYLRAQRPIATQKGPTVAPISVEIGVGYVKIGRQLPLPGYALVLDYFSRMCFGESDACLEANGKKLSKTEKEIDDPGFDFLDFVQPVEQSHVSILEEYRNELLWRMFQGAKGINLVFCHKYAVDFFSSPLIPTLHGLNLLSDPAQWDYPPSLEEVFRIFKTLDEFKEIQDKSVFLAMLKNVRISFFSRGSLNKVPFLACVEGEVKTKEGGTYFFVGGAWQKVSVEYHVLLQRDFNRLLDKHLAKEGDPAHLPLPWIVDESWASFSQEDIATRVSTPAQAETVMAAIAPHVDKKGNRYLMKCRIDVSKQGLSDADRIAVETFLKERFALRQATKAEGPYNEMYLYDQMNGGEPFGPEEGWIVGDRIDHTARKLELFDVAKYTKDTCYLFHVKNGLEGNGTRIACAQIRESAQQFRELIGNPSSDVIDEFWSEVTNSQKEGYRQTLKAQLNHLGKAAFKAIFRDRNIVFVFAFLDSGTNEERLLENETKRACEVAFVKGDFDHPSCCNYYNKKVVTPEKILQSLEKKGYLSQGKVTNHFLVCAKKDFLLYGYNSKNCKAIYDIIANKLAPFLSEYDSTAIKIELLAIQQEFKDFGFKICQIRRPKGAVGSSEVKEEERTFPALPEMTSVGVENLGWEPKRTFAFEGQNYRRLTTRGDGSCALHAVLGQEVDGVVSYQTGLAAKNDFFTRWGEAVQNAEVMQLYQQNIYALFDQDSTPFREIEGYQAWVVGNFTLTGQVVGLEMQEAMIWKELVNRTDDLGIQLRDRNPPDEDQAYVNWVGEQRDQLEALLPENPSQELAEILQRREEVITRIAQIRGERDREKEIFLLSERVLNKYHATFLRPEYFLNSLEIHMAALLYNKRVTILHEGENGQVERSENDFNPDSPDHVTIFHQGAHFEKCVERIPAE